MRSDVEQQLAALGRSWDRSVPPVTAREIAARQPGPSDRTRYTTDEEHAMVDLETVRPAEEGRTRPRRFAVVGLAAAAAAAVVVAFAVVARDDDPVAPADAPSPSAALPPVQPDEALFGAEDRPVEPGTYSIDRVEERAVPPIVVTIGEGWVTRLGWAVSKGDGMLLTFSRPERIVLDSCDPSAGDHPGPLTTLEGVVTALREQGGWVDVTSPEDVVIDGYAGATFQRATPAPRPTGCSGDFLSWEGPVGASSQYPPGDTESLLVLDLDGEIVVVEARVNPGQPDEAHAELQAMLDSIRIVAPD